LMIYTWSIELDRDISLGLGCIAIKSTEQPTYICGGTFSKAIISEC
jgi:hypothetical protein